MYNSLLMMMNISLTIHETGMIMIHSVDKKGDEMDSYIEL